MKSKSESIQIKAIKQNFFLWCCLTLFFRRKKKQNERVTNLSIWANIQIRACYAYHWCSFRRTLRHWACVHWLCTYGTVIVDVTNGDVDGGQWIAAPRIRSGESERVEILSFTIQESIGRNNSSVFIDSKVDAVGSCVKKPRKFMNTVKLRFWQISG